ncbi:MAG: protein-glutamate O-methyltransferase CheR [Rhizomicrobium sp.]
MPMRLIQIPRNDLKPTEITLSDEAFHRLADFVYQRCGIHITSRKRTMLEARVRRRMQETGIERIETYCRFLVERDNLESEEEAIHLIDAVTVNKTDFFREPTHFSYLTKTILPELVAKGQRNFKIWSAASSYGAEPYTIAMVVDDFCQEHSGCDYFVLGTDICTKVLEKASAARYSEAQIAPIPPQQRRRHVMVAKDKTRREYRMAPHLRSKVAFLQLNLFGDHYPISVDYDVIFCRNVLIYFDKKTQKRLLNQLILHMKPDGYLILGHSESTVGMDLPLVSVANTIFRRREA